MPHVHRQCSGLEVFETELDENLSTNMKALGRSVYFYGM